MVCLDTSIIIDYLKGDVGVVGLIKSYPEYEKISTTAVTVYELFKHQDKIRRDTANEFLSKIKIYYFDDKSAIESSQIFRNLKERGKEINKNDIFISGIAFVNNESILTRDSDFKNIEESNRIIII